MFSQDPIIIEAPLGRVYGFTRHQCGTDFFGPRPPAFVHDRIFAKQNLYDLARDLSSDPFNYQLLDVWQMAVQKPWTSPRDIHHLIGDLADRIHRGELFVYLEKAAGEEHKIPSEDANQSTN